MAVAAVAAGCGEDICGFGDAQADGLLAETDSAELRYGQFVSSPNNDCSVAGAPTSLTIEGEQVSPAATPRRPFTLCVPRPDQIDDAAIPLDDDTRIQVIDVFAALDGCDVAIDRDVTPTGTITFRGYCADGVDPAGYAMTLDGTVGIERICPGSDPEPLTLTVSGTVAVTTP